MPSLSWHWLALASILALDTVLVTLHLDQAPYPTQYYAAAVKSMLSNWHAFVFASFDPLGFVTLDKPPLGFWAQVASAKLLGFSPLSLILPQAVAGVLSVWLLYRLVARAYGAVVGVLSALALTLTPIVVVTDRTNNIDSLLLLTLLAATWAISRASESGRLRWLLLCALLVGLAFNIKLLETYLVLPAFGLLYLFLAPVGWRRRVAHLALTSAILLAVSLSWAVAVDLTPAAQRPYIGSTSSNSVLELIVGHDGLSILQGQAPPTALHTTGTSGQPTPQALHPVGYGVGPRSPLRLLDDELAGQVSWLLPFALVGLLAAAGEVRWRGPLTRREQSLVLWATWLGTQALFFSVVGFAHPYYLILLAPALSALVGIGAGALWRGYRQAGWRGWLLPAALLVTMTLQVHIVAAFPVWSSWLVPLLLGFCAIATGILLWLRRSASAGAVAFWRAGALTAGGLAVLIGPLTWSMIAVTANHSSMFPIAGPEVIHTGTAPPYADPLLVRYAQAAAGTSRYLLAVPSADLAAPLMLVTGRPVLALGGFLGTDPILTPARLAHLVAANDVRLFLLPASWQTSVADWVRSNCAPVPPALWQTGPGDLPGSAVFNPDTPQLYACGAAPGA